MKHQFLLRQFLSLLLVITSFHLYPCADLTDSPCSTMIRLGVMVYLHEHPPSPPRLSFKGEVFSGDQIPSPWIIRRFFYLGNSKEYAIRTIHRTISSSEKPSYRVGEDTCETSSWQTVYIWNMYRTPTDQNGNKGRQTNKNIGPKELNSHLTKEGIQITDTQYSRMLTVVIRQEKAK